MARTKMTPPTIEPAPAPPEYDELLMPLVSNIPPTLVSVASCLINPEQVALIRRQPAGACVLFLAGNPSPFYFTCSADELASLLCPEGA